jgi:hypothetical protein
MHRTLVAAVVGSALVVLGPPASAAVPPTAQAARPCLVAGRVILDREHITCRRAKRVARHFFGYFDSPSGWDCYGSRGQVWRGYCESSRSYFRWRRV